MPFNATFSIQNNMQANFMTDPDMAADFTEIIEGGVNLPPGGAPGDLLAKRTSTDGDVEWITPANSAEQDNTRPITAAAVYLEIGNINALLATI